MNLRKIAITAAATFTITLPSLAAVKPGESAPDFQGRDSNGKTQSLAQYRGKFVVLEWANEGCPYEKKHYESGNMERLQKEWTAKGVIWLSVLSSAPGQEGFVSASEENAYLSKMHASSLIPPAPLAACTVRRPRRTCSSSTQAARSSTRVHSTTNPHPTRQA